jgi:hypothetical protein
MTTITIDYSTSELIIDSPSGSLLPNRPARHVSRQRVSNPDETYRVLDELLNALDVRDVELIAETSYDPTENAKVVW